jgi:hypothetical protein
LLQLKAAKVAANLVMLDITCTTRLIKKLQML